MDGSVSFKRRGNDDSKIWNAVRPEDAPASIPRREARVGSAVGGANKLAQAVSGIRWRHLGVLLVIWLVTIHYLERTVVNRAISKCSWKKWERWESSKSRGDHATGPIDPYRVAIVGDPQIVDEYSYKTRPKPLLRLTQTLSDNYLHRNYMAVHRKLSPHSVMFLGDLFDGGREWDDDVWLREYLRFASVFPPLEHTKSIFSIPGNHDIGFGNDVNATRLKRFRTMFGEANEYQILGNHTFVLIDSISLSATDLPEVNTEPTIFLESLVNDKKMKEYPRILLSHVPLYRFTDRQHCGPLRESKKRFPVMKGKQYQTVLEYELSQRLLEIVRPKLIFSGDDHDYCHVRHPFDQAYGEGSISGGGAGNSYADEITIKTFAMTGGIKYPAIQLLSLWNPRDGSEPDTDIQETGEVVVTDSTFRTRLCYMPDPYHALRIYAALMVFSISSLFLVCVTPRLCRKIHVLLFKDAARRSSILPTIAESDAWAVKPTRPATWKDCKIPERPNAGVFFLCLLLLFTEVWIVFWVYFSRA
ncbi:unnamed protein product [Kuraishia capsulata CBS 1993]|uniref:Calcineurin-like phosphoesterase domain-containing protein n=1 Tax=Kuraishia capsulata CBS 1993 TaxID=1382522 RepID=W6MSV6_9ASCO|nr:uncharacterized protein KUCA_T00004289001 [Kuraishia capsulata CBS 1993]CDK28307.1 unnamed protein product [Kuraishia capsulata CBS 1993]